MLSKTIIIFSLFVCGGTTVIATAFCKNWMKQPHITGITLHGMLSKNNDFSLGF